MCGEFFVENSKGKLQNWWEKGVLYFWTELLKYFEARIKYVMFVLKT